MRTTNKILSFESESESAYLKNQPTVEAFENLEAMAKSLASDISIALGAELEELQTHRAEFRVGLQNAFLRILRTAQQKSEGVVIFNEAIPGFTLMLFKKSPDDFLSDPRYSYTPQAVQQGRVSPEGDACSLLATQFFQRTGSKVLSIETVDAVFAFFPVEDLKDNLKEMGFYLVGD